MEGLKPVSGCSAFVTCVELYSRYIVCFPIANKTSKTIGEKLEQFVFQQFQSPRNIHSDVGINLQSKFLKETLSFYSIKLRKGVPHSPWSHGTVEVQNRWVQTLVRILCTQYRISWVRALPLACILLNSTKKPQLGDRSSYEILFGNDYSQISVISTPGTEWGKISSNSAPVASYARNRKQAIRPDNR